MDINSYTYVDWTRFIQDQCSTSGYFTIVGGNLVMWQSKKQKLVARSSVEVEYKGMTKVICKLL